MKLLRVKANNFKNCCDGFTIDLTPKARKSSEDKEYELQEIAPGLFAFNTLAFIGKNASGKTTAIELLDCAYSILGDFRLEGKHYSYDGVKLEIHSVFFASLFIRCDLSEDFKQQTDSRRFDRFGQQSQDNAAVFPKGGTADRYAAT